MNVGVLYQFGRRFAAISAEAPGIGSHEAYGELMKRCRAELELLGLSLGDVVRTRLWARTREDRDAASVQRRELSGDGPRPATSSYIAPEHFFSDASVGVELLAMEPLRKRPERYHVEYDPSVAPVRYLVYDGMVFLSGVSAGGATLKDAIAESLATIEESLGIAKLRWRSAVSVAAYVQRRHALAEARTLLLAAARVKSAPMKLVPVEGFSSPPKMIEVEVTARL